MYKILDNSVNSDLSNLTATGENHFAKPDLSNLNRQGEQTAALLAAPSNITQDYDLGDRQYDLRDFTANTNGFLNFQGIADIADVGLTIEAGGLVVQSQVSGRKGEVLGIVCPVKAGTSFRIKLQKYGTLPALTYFINAFPNFLSLRMIPAEGMVE